MSLKILLVDGDDSWLTSAREFLADQMYEITAVTNGRDAQIALYNEKFFAVIMNYSVQNHSCIQVIKFIKTNHVGQRVIIVVNNREIVDRGEVTEEKISKTRCLRSSG